MLSVHIYLLYPVKTFAVGLLTIDIHAFFFFPARILLFTFALEVL